MSKTVFLAALVAASLAGAAEAQETLTPEVLAAADLEHGETLFKFCRSCHSVLPEGEKFKTGPRLWHVFGRPVGSLEDYHYSKALENADFAWTPDKLNEWLLKPRDFLPGTRMTFAGFPKEEDRVALIAYLVRETGGDPASATGATPDDPAPAGDEAAAPQ